MLRSLFSRLWWAVAIVLPAAAGPLVRGPNPTLQLPEVPGSFGYQLVNAFPGTTFAAPLAMANPPGETNRLFVVEQGGRIMVLPDLGNPQKEVFLDLSAKTVAGGEQGLLGLAFHPGYATNGRLFLFRTVTASTTGHASQLHDRLSEFRVSAANPNRADTASELILFQQADPASNHNGGDVHFGPDGYLYVSLGDGGGGNDQFGNAQKIDADLFAGLLRLDVDNRPESLAPNPHPSVVGNYRIPADNPFVGATAFLGKAVLPAKVRTEYFAVGLRNPWRWSFDSANGDLWIGDVGQDKWENIFLTRKGANHGWSFREGNLAGPKTGMPTGFLTDPKFNYVAPLHTYAHGTATTQGNSLTGGFVYRGARLAQLFGVYIYADYVSGNVWSLRRQDSGAPTVTRLLGQTGIAAFGADPRTGDILAANVNSGLIQRLDYNPTFTGAPIPPTLADTGALAETASLTPASGFVAYAVNQSFWSDGAQKRRWFRVPDGRFLGFATNETWSAPAGTVWMKHFDLELTNGVPASARRLETRLLVRNPDGVYGVTYRWNSRTNAGLVPEEGADETITRVINGVAQTQTWHYPSRAECLACHNSSAGHALGFNTAQLNRRFTYADGTTTNQLAALAEAGYFVTPPASLTPLPALAAVDDESVSVDWRVRSYLAANCGFCHRPGGPGGGFFDARLQTKTALTGLINGPLNDPHGDTNNRVLVPGAPDRSVLLRRQSARGAGQMPPLASNVPDAPGSELIQRWIFQLGDPLVTEPVSLRVHRLNGRLRLQVQQPFDQALELETTDRLTSPTWLRLDLPGTEPTYPALPRDLDFELPLEGGAHFYRARTEAP